ncbi:MAG: peptidoglycan editing factor PgeF [Prevotella sp.]|nr:peptidoglycan editing factor PgeF [Prevotella sp.]
MKQPVLTYYEMGPSVVAFSTTRQGGYSEGKYAEFNMNRYCGDDVESIRRNREALAQLLGIGSERILMPHQVHDTKVLSIDEDFFSLPAEVQQQRLEGVDAVMTNCQNLCIGVSTADCIPVLLYDAEHQAVCAIHAGWRGTVARIVEKAISAMTKVYGSRPSEILAQIAPGISLESFEVGDEVYEAFEKAGFDMKSIAQRFPVSSNVDEECAETKWHLNLPECNRLQLLASGVPETQIGVSRVCTYQSSETYFSARRLGINSGRIFTAIMLK